MLVPFSISTVSTFCPCNPCDRLKLRRLPLKQLLEILFPIKTRCGVLATRFFLRNMTCTILSKYYNKIYRVDQMNCKHGKELLSDILYMTVYGANRTRMFATSS